MNENTLHSSNLKNTAKRSVILEYLENATAPLTAESIYLGVISKMHMSVSTTYRTLGTLTNKGLVLKTIRQDGKAYYEINHLEHKHHIECMICHEQIPIDHCPIEQLSKELESTTGFKITGHNLEFSGICPKCSKKNKPKK